jgi:hypothetical protein
MSVEYVRKNDVEALIKAYFKTKIEDGEKALDPGDTGVELLRILDGTPTHVLKDDGSIEWCSVTGIVDALAAAAVGALAAAAVGEWISCELMLPEEEQVLALVCGKYKNITFDHAVLIAEYVDGEWILDQYQEAENITVSHWAFIPDLPAEVKK